MLVIYVGVNEDLRATWLPDWCAWRMLSSSTSAAGPHHPASLFLRHLAGYLSSRSDGNWLRLNVYPARLTSGDPTCIPRCPRSRSLIRMTGSASSWTRSKGGRCGMTWSSVQPNSCTLRTVVCGRGDFWDAMGPQAYWSLYVLTCLGGTHSA